MACPASVCKTGFLKLLLDGDSCELDAWKLAGVG